jgi:hypothetical protein
MSNSEDAERYLVNKQKEIDRQRFIFRYAPGISWDSHSSIDIRHRKTDRRLAGIIK